QGGAVQFHQVAGAEVAGADGHIHFGTVVAERGGAVHHDLGDGVIAGGDTGGLPAADARRGDAGDTALYVNPESAHNAVAEVDIALSVRGNRRRDEHPGVESGR